MGLQPVGPLSRSPSAQPPDETGDSFVVTLLAVLVLLGAFLMATDFVVDQYGMGVVRTAVDEGAQAGALAGDPQSAVAACQAKESEVMGGLLAGQLGRRLHFSCSIQANLVVASAGGQLPGWLPPAPAVEVRQVGTEHLESTPGPTAP